MDYNAKNLKQKQAMGLAGYAIQSVATGNLHTAWSSLNEAIGFVNELIEDTVEHDDGN